MGQRTQILLQTVDLDGVSNVKVYHEQWGYARTMPNLLMGLVISIEYGNSNRFKPYTDKTIHEAVMDSWDVTEHYDYIGQINLNDVEQVKNVLKGSDNNNGYMIVQLAQYKDENHYLPQTKVTVKFMRGIEDCPNSYYERFSRKKLEEWEFKYVSFDKYCKAFSCYCDKNFKKLFKDFCKYKDVSIDVNAKFVEPNLQNNIEQALLNDSEVVKEVSKGIV